MPFPSHRRQFVIAARPHRPASEWKSILLPTGYYLSHSSDLRVTAVDGPTRIRWTLLGDAYQSDPRLPEPATQLTAVGETSVEHVTMGWAGAWALIGGDRLTTDVGSLLGVYYVPESVNDSQGAVIASSLPLIDELRGRRAAPHPRLQWQSGLDWYPPPLTGVEGVRKLLASQSLLFPQCVVEPRRLNIVGHTDRSHEQRVLHALTLLSTVLRHASRSYGTVWLALTAGYDSRTTLAAALNAGLDVRTFTIVHGGLSYGDRAVPPVLARRAQVQHQFVRARHRARVGRLRAWDTHNGGTSTEIDREFYARGQYDFAQRDDVILRSGCYEASKCLYWSLIDATEGVPHARYILDELGITADVDRERGLNEWLAWAEATPEAGLDWRNRLYAEQRMGGWLSATEQALTLLPARSLQPANSSAVISALWDFPLAARRSGEHQREVVARVAPELDELPYNPKKSILARKVKKRIFRTYTRASRQLTAARRAV